MLILTGDLDEHLYAARQARIGVLGSRVDDLTGARSA